MNTISSNSTLAQEKELKSSSNWPDQEKQGGRQLNSVKSFDSVKSSSSTLSSADFPEDDDEEEEGFVRKSDRWKVALFLVVLVILVALFVKFDVMAKLTPFFLWVEAHPIPGMLAHISLIVVISVFSVPGSSIIYIAGGLLFRPFYFGLLVNMFGVMLGTIVVTVLSLRLYGDWAKKQLKSNKKLYRLTVVIKESGFWMTVCLRFIIPYFVASYLFPHLNVDPSAYLAGTVLAMLFHLVPDTIIGSLLSNVSSISSSSEHQDNRLKYTIVLITAVVVISVMASVITWCNAAFDLVQGKKMIAPMSFSKLKSSQKNFLLILHIGLVGALIFGPVIIWQTSLFAPK